MFLNTGSKEQPRSLAYPLGPSSGSQSERNQSSLSLFTVKTQGLTWKNTDNVEEMLSAITKDLAPHL